MGSRALPRSSPTVVQSRSPALRYMWTRRGSGIYGVRPCGGPATVSPNAPSAREGPSIRRIGDAVRTRASDPLGNRDLTPTSRCSASTALLAHGHAGRIPRGGRLNLVP